MDNREVSRDTVKRVKMNFHDEDEEEVQDAFDLSHIPLKENSHEFPLWVGDVKKKFYKKGNAYGAYKKSSDDSELVKYNY
jgi:hypothetical protein